MTFCIDCGSDKIENEDIGLCGSCGLARRKAERQASRVKVVTPVRKVAPKRAKELQEYTRLKKEYFLTHPMCEVLSCNNWATDIHHQAGREGERLLDTNYFMAVCSDHHRYYTEHSAEAIEHGISLKRTL